LLYKSRSWFSMPSLLVITCGGLLFVSEEVISPQLLGQRN
jgi:hypothetical protein